MKSVFSPTSFVNSFSINFGNIPFLEIKKLIFFNNVIFFIYNIRRTTSPGADRGLGSSQSIHTILVLTLNYHVFFNTVAFRNTYPNQPYTSHALHALLQTYKNKSIYTFSSEPFALIYCIYYKLLGTQLNPGARINREPVGKTMLIQCSTPNTKVEVPKMIQWQDVKLPTECLLEQESPLAKPAFDELDLTNIQQYLDGSVKISFQNNQPLKINEGRHSFVGGRHSFAGSESISKRDQDLNEFLQKKFEKPDLRLKGVSSGNSQVSFVFYSTKPEISSPYGRIANEEEEDTRSVCPSVFDFPPIETLDYPNQLKVLNVLNESFEIDMVSLYNEFISAKNREKRKYYQSTFAQLKKIMLKGNGKKK